MLEKEMGHRHQITNEQARHNFSVFHSLCIRWTDRQTAKYPGQGEDQVGDHEDIMPHVIIGRSHIRPSSARQRPQDACRCDDPR